ncbi:asparagine synthase (glutamine-hydrolyzing) [Chitinophagaceae bacterium MMS25-I14]
MCGITGFYALHKNAAANLTKITQSNGKLILRGPDSGAIFTDERVALGHRRLSIIDTSSAATQPMEDISGRYIMVFNGEIFNFKQLSGQYLSATWQRIGGARTSSDTEILLYLLIAYGTDCLAWLDGFFAFSFYDRETGTMIVARDRYGKKPLLYYACSEYVAFASEMKALLEYDIPRELNYDVLHQYLQLNYVPQPQSMLKGVAKVRPGHYMIIKPDGEITDQPYYELKTHPEQYKQYTYEQAKEQLILKMDTAVQERMISDVPLGAFLSGGIDSSVIVALASRYTDKLNTFSVGYKDNAFFDETHYAQLVAKQYKTNHTVFSLSNNDFLEHVHDVLDYLDEPFADSSAIPVYILSKHTRQHVTVALSGDGGDEVFAGYNKHAAEWRVRQRSLANTLVKAGLPVWSILPRSRNNKLTNKFRQLHRFAAGASLSQQERYWRWASFNTIAQVNNLLRPEIAQKVNMPALEEEKRELLSCLQTDDYNEVLLADMNLVLLSDMLVKVDMMSMANSLEVRSPFLDHKLVDFAFGLPSEYKIDGGLKKKVVQDAFRPMLPAELYNRPKHGFEIPLLDWFRKELWGLINDDLLQKDFVTEQGIFNPSAIEHLKKKLHSSNPEDSHATIWALIVFQYWWKKYMA